MSRDITVIMITTQIIRMATPAYYIDVPFGSSLVALPEILGDYKQCYKLQCLQYSFEPFKFHDLP